MFKHIKLYACFVFSFLLTTCMVCNNHALADYAKLSLPEVGQGSLKVHYLDEGRGNKTLVFVHGWSCDTNSWKFQTGFFKKDYRVLVLDLPGHGKSSKPKIPYTLDLFSESIKSVLDAEQIEKAFLIGHSMGYTVSRLFIKKYPTRVTGFANVDGAYFRIPEKSKIKEWEETNRGYAQQLNSDKRDEFMKMFLDSLFVDQTPPELERWIRSTMLSTAEHVANSAMESMLKTENWYEYSLSVPTIAVYAAMYHLPADNEAYLRTLFPKLEYHVWNGVGHFIMMEKPDKFNKLLATYLATIPF